MESNIKAYLNNIMTIVGMIKDICPDTERGEEIANLCNNIIEELDLMEMHLEDIGLGDKIIKTEKGLEELDKRVRRIEKEIVKIEKYLDWITERLEDMPEKCFNNMDW